MTSQPTSNESAASERRNFYRKKLNADLEIEWGSATLTATVRDIGPRGLFIELTPPLWVGATFRARLIVTPILPLDCTVRRVEPGGGIAVSFELPEEPGKAQLDALLAGLPQA
jgi:hypothetical protein